MHFLAALYPLAELRSTIVAPRVSLTWDVHTHDCGPDMDARSKNESKHLTDRVNKYPENEPRYLELRKITYETSSPLPSIYTHV